jgi:hypothetical protein
MKRNALWAVLVLALIAAAPRNAQAQLEWLFPGSTVGGDHARGEGVAAFGWGQYAYLASLARANDVYTLLVLNDRACQYYAAQVRSLSARARRRKTQVRDALDASARRALDHPTDAVVTGGNSLNHLVRELTSPGVHPSELRRHGVPVGDGVLGQVPLRLARAGEVVSPTRLLPGTDWPGAFRRAETDPARLAYERAAAVALGRGSLTPAEVDAVGRAVADLRAALHAASPGLTAEGRRAAWAFLNDLTRATRALHNPEAVVALRAVTTERVATVADLLGFVRRYGLSFAPAESPAEKELYRELYHALCRQRQRLAEDRNVSLAGGDPRAGRPDNE